MPPFRDTAFDHFLHIHQAVKDSFDEQIRQTEQKLRQPGTSATAHFFISFFFVMVSWFFIVNEPLKSLLADLKIDVTGTSPIILLILGFGIWALILSLINRFVYRKLSMKGSLAIYNIVVLPLFPALLILSVAERSIALTVYVVWAVLSLAGWLFIFGIFWMISGNIPRFLFMVLSSIGRDRPESALIPGYTAMTRHAARRIANNQQLADLTAQQWQDIEAIARWKLDGINGRIQSFSFGLAAIGILSLATLVFSENDLRAIWEGLWRSLLQILGLETSNEGLLITLLLLVSLALLSVFYFARSYSELRTLEAIGIICALAANNGSAASSSEVDRGKPDKGAGVTKATVTSESAVTDPLASPDPSPHQKITAEPTDNPDHSDSRR
ncbi:Yip1 family protein [Chloroflexus sp.]|uniref:Yip1 family protein n=1 Tax=Chloroflexus sp. TaxID=1904827 RepID=UPI00260E7A53|nr:Yip1 family protein [uncultured Chloroflexus sp.]